MGLVNVPRSKRDAEYRYKMPDIICRTEGRGNGIRTCILNMGDICKALKRPQSYVTKFFSIQLNAGSHISEAEGTSTFNGAHQLAALQKAIDVFIEKFVLCPRCELPEIDLVVSRKDVSYTCNACGNRGSFKHGHKLIGYIKKNAANAQQTNSTIKIDKESAIASSAEMSRVTEPVDRKSLALNDFLLSDLITLVFCLEKCLTLESPEEIVDYLRLERTLSTLKPRWMAWLMTCSCYKVQPCLLLALIKAHVAALEIDDREPLEDLLKKVARIEEICGDNALSADADCSALKTLAGSEGLGTPDKGAVSLIRGLELAAFLSQTLEQYRCQPEAGTSVSYEHFPYILNHLLTNDLIDEDMITERYSIALKTRPLAACTPQWDPSWDALPAPCSLLVCSWKRLEREIIRQAGNQAIVAAKPFIDFLKEDSEQE